MIDKIINKEYKEFINYKVREERIIRGIKMIKKSTSILKNIYLKFQTPKRQFFIIFFTQLIIFCLLILSDNIHYATNDDTTMVDIASGAYGKPSQYIINIHIFWGWLYKILFQMIPNINWVIISYIFMYLISFAMLDYVFIDKKSNIFLTYLTMNTAFIVCVSYFSFTIVAYVGAIAGLIAMLYGVEQKKSINFFTISGMLLMFVGGAFRGEVIKSLLVILVFVIITKIGKERALRYFFVILYSTILMIGIIQSNLCIEKINPIMNEALEWGETRSAALDCAVVPYNEEIFEQNNITYEQYLMMYNAFYYDKESLPIVNFEKLIQMNNIKNKYNFDVIQFIKELKDKCSVTKLFSKVYIYLFVVLLLIYVLRVLVDSGNKDFTALGILIGVVGVEFIFFFIQRNYYRVIMPNYIFATMLLLFYMPRINVVNKLSKIWKGVENSCLLFVFILALIFRFSCYDLFSDSLKSDGRKAVLEYMEENNEVILLAGDPTVFSVDVARNIFDFTAKHGKWTIMGNWEIYSQPYYDLMSEYGIANPDKLLLEAINNPQIKILTTAGDDFPENYGYSLSWLKKRYNIDAFFVKEANISEVKVDDEYTEYWTLYSLRAN